MRPPILPITLWFAFFSIQLTAQITAPFLNKDNLHRAVCGTEEWNELHAIQDPVFRQELEEWNQKVVPELSAASPEKSLVDTLISIPVVVHIIHQGEPIGTGQNLSEAQILAQIAILNEDFQSLNPQFFNSPAQWTSILGVPNIQFCLASLDPDGNPTNGITRHQLEVTGPTWTDNNINSEIKPMTNWDPVRYYNIYVLPIPGTTAQGGVVGFSNQPTPAIFGTATDGSVVDYRWFGAPGFGSSGFRPLTHETGHYLGLFHPFKGNSCSLDDGIEDTPNVNAPTSDLVTLNCANGFPDPPVSCGNQHLYINYMDFVNENCYTSFTKGQVNVMRAVLDGTAGGLGFSSREALVANSNLVCNLSANDAGIARIISPEERLCTSTEISPSVTLRNFGMKSLTSVEINFQINGNPPFSMNWTGNLFPGQSTEVSLPHFLPPAGMFDFQVFTNLPNGVADERLVNDTSGLSIQVSISKLLPLSENFEGLNNLPSLEGIFPFNPDLDAFAWTLTFEASAFGQGSESVVFDNFNGTNTNNPSGTIDALITPHYDFSNVQGAVLTFDVAYANFDSLMSDTLLVLVAANCGAFFDQIIFSKGGETLRTAPPTTNLFTPAANEWRTETVDLSAFDHNSDLIFAFVNSSGFGNRLFLDNINVASACSNFSIAVSTQNVTCNSLCDGTASIAVSGSNGAISYLWDANAGGQTTSTATGLCAGTFAVTVSDELGCSATTTNITIEEPPLLTATATATGETAAGANDGLASAEPSGGNGGFTFVWNTGATSSIIGNLPPGDYFVTVTDAKGCTTTASTSVNAFNCAGFTVVVPVTNAACFGEASGTAAAFPLGGSPPHTFLWSDGQTTQIAANLAAGTYSVTVTDADSCPEIKEISVSEPLPLVAQLSATSETSAGANDGTATVEISGGTPSYQILWSNGETTPTITGLSPNTYNVTITDANSCTASSLVTVNSFDCGGFSSTISSTNISCFGSNDGTATVLPAGGIPPYGFNWSNGQQDSIINNLPPAGYQVTVTDASNCSTVLGTTLSEPVPLDASVSITHESANGANDGTAAVSANGGTPPYAYNWSNGESSAAISNLPPGNYSVTIQDGNACLFSETITINSFNCSLTAEVTLTEAACPNGDDGTAAANALNGLDPFEFAWSNGATGPLVENLSPGSYSVTVADAANCSTVSSFQITGKPLSINCEDDILVTNCEQQVNYSLPEFPDNCGATLTLTEGLESGAIFPFGTTTVTYQLTDESGNFAVCSFQITLVNDLAVTNSITEPSCDGFADGSIQQSITGGTPPYQTAWSHGGQPLHLPAGMYGFTVTDANGCTTDGTIDLPQPEAIQFSIDTIVNSTDNESNGAIEISVSGGNPPYFFEWQNNGLVISNEEDPENLPPGEYVVIVKDANSCYFSSSPIAIDNLVATQEPDLQSFVNIFPNPTSGEVLVETALPANPKPVLILLDVNGKRLSAVPVQQLSNHSWQLDYGGQAPGIYFIKIVAGKLATTKKIVVLK